MSKIVDDETDLLANVIKLNYIRNQEVISHAAIRPQRKANTSFHHGSAVKNSPYKHDGDNFTLKRRYLYIH